MHHNFLVQKEEWQQKEAMTAGDSIFSGCLTEMYHITPIYERTSPSHTCTNVLTITYTYHHHLLCAQNNGAALSMNSTVADNGSSPATAHLFYDLLYLQYIPNALWIDVVLSALAFTLHFKCGCLWNGLEWNWGGGQRESEPVSYFHLLPSPSLTSVSFPSLTLSLEINDKMSNLWNGVFLLPSMTVQDRVIIRITEIDKLYQRSALT